MLAMVLRWFICDIAMATEAGGNPMGSRGWGIIMKGRSNPERRRKKERKREEGELMGFLKCRLSRKQDESNQLIYHPSKVLIPS